MEGMLTTWFRKGLKLAEKLSRRVLMKPRADKTTSRAFDAISKLALSIRIWSNCSSTLSATSSYDMTKVNYDISIHNRKCHHFLTMQKYLTKNALTAVHDWCNISVKLTTKWKLQMPSVLWHCWLGGRKGIQPAKNEGDDGSGYWLVGCSGAQPDDRCVCLC